MTEEINKEKIQLELIPTHKSMPHKRVQTAEGWKKGQVRKRKSSKSASKS